MARAVTRPVRHSPPLVRYGAESERADPVRAAPAGWSVPTGTRVAPLFGRATAVATLGHVAQPAVVRPEVGTARDVGGVAGKCVHAGDDRGRGTGAAEGQPAICA